MHHRFARLFVVLFYVIQNLFYVSRKLNEGAFLQLDCSKLPALEFSPISTIIERLIQQIGSDTRCSMPPMRVQSRAKVICVTTAVKQRSQMRQ
jgi:hypothetical protein